MPQRDSQRLFEFFILDGAQAGLSWITILKRREGYRRAFKNFDVDRVARFSNKDVERLMQDTEIIRNRLKIESTIKNAKAFCAMRDGGDDFSQWLWDWVDGKPIDNKFKAFGKIPASTPLSENISKELKKRGWTFVGPTIVYAVMQAAGLVNDHLVSCFRHDEVAQIG
ncbi:MAG: DNA-3-methyladenine glycosylase I [Termitinemataceae bacterium]|nr:MAG: DNA-3-methyladenine glycosylase I [Termitinemataceae bacterium]